MRLGTVLKKWRVMSELDLRQASKEIGIAHSTLQRLEDGKLPPHGETVVKLLNWLLEENSNGDPGPQPSNETSAGKGE